MTHEVLELLLHRDAVMTEDALRRTEEAIQAALDEVRESRIRFRAASAEKMQAQQQPEEETEE